MGPRSRPPQALQVVSTAGRRAYLAELGMYGGTVVALVVVLGQDLPVRRYLVVVAGGDDELLATVVSDQILQIASVFLERGRVAASVGEEPPLPFHDALVAGVFGAARAAGADPATVEEVLPLPPEHGPGGVHLGWEGAAAAESVQRRCEKLAGYRRHVILPPCRPRGSCGRLLLLECRNCTGNAVELGREHDGFRHVAVRRSGGRRGA